MNELKGIKAALFDLDGTLFDSAELWSDIDVEFLKRRGLSPTEEYRRGIAALGNRDVAKFTISLFKLSDTEEELMQEWEGLALKAYETTVGLIDGAKQYLDRTAASGVKMYAVTSLPRELAVAGLKANGIDFMFEKIFIADEVGVSKTTPEFYERVARAIALEPRECVTFDDLVYAVRSAKRAGMAAVAVRGEKAHYDGAEIEEGDADYVVTSFFDAPKIVRA